MPEQSGNIRIIEMETFDRHGGKALMVHLPPSSEGRSRVAFVPVKAGGLMTEGLRSRLVEELLST